MGRSPSDPRGEGARPAEVLFLYPGSSPALYQALLQVQPRLVIPIHWDNLYRSASRPERPFFELPRLAWPPLRRIDLAAFQRQVKQAAPAVGVLIPEVGRFYELFMAPR